MIDVDAARKREEIVGRDAWEVASEDGDINGRIMSLGPFAGYGYDALELDRYADAEFIEAVSQLPADRSALLAEVEELGGLVIAQGRSVNKGILERIDMQKEIDALRERLAKAKRMLLDINECHSGKLCVLCTGKLEAYWREERGLTHLNGGRS